SSETAMTRSPGATKPASLTATKRGFASGANIHSNGFCQANHAAPVVTITSAASTPLPHQRERRPSWTATATSAIARIGVTVGDTRRIQYASSIARGVCAPNGWSITSGTTTRAAAASGSADATIHLRVISGVKGANIIGAMNSLDLERWRGEFPILARTVYMISNSLGAMPRQTARNLAEYAEVWATRGVRGW